MYGYGIGNFGYTNPYAYGMNAMYPANYGYNQVPQMPQAMPMQIAPALPQYAADNFEKNSSSVAGEVVKYAVVAAAAVGITLLAKGKVKKPKYKHFSDGEILDRAIKINRARQRRIKINKLIDKELKEAMKARENTVSVPKTVKSAPPVTNKGKKFKKEQAQLAQETQAKNEQINNILSGLKEHAKKAKKGKGKVSVATTKPTEVVKPEVEAPKKGFWARRAERKALKKEAKLAKEQAQLAQETQVKATGQNLITEGQAKPRKTNIFRRTTDKVETFINKKQYQLSGKRKEEARFAIQHNKTAKELENALAIYPKTVANTVVEESAPIVAKTKDIAAIAKENVKNLITEGQAKPRKTNIFHRTADKIETFILKRRHNISNNKSKSQGPTAEYKARQRQLEESFKLPDTTLGQTTKNCNNPFATASARSIDKLGAQKYTEFKNEVEKSISIATNPSELQKLQNQVATLRDRSQRRPLEQIIDERIAELQK